MENKNNSIITILLILILVLLVGFGAYYLGSKNSFEKEKGQNIKNNDLQDQTSMLVDNIKNEVIPNDQQVKNTILLNFSSKYIKLSPWPPKVERLNTLYVCNPVKSDTIMVSEKNINGKSYCFTSSIDGGAGHFGGNYIYTTRYGNGIKSINFSLNYTSCGGYGGPGDPEYDVCKKDQSKFFDNIDFYISSLM